MASAHTHSAPAPVAELALNGRHTHRGEQCETPAAVECRGVVKRFGHVLAVDGLDLTVPQGRVMALLGPSGCGKTTALRLVAGFEQPDTGTISINGRYVWRPGSGVPPEKRHVGMVFQEGALFPHLTVEQNVSYGLPRESGRDGIVKDVLGLVGLYGLRNRMPHELSGGQQQRVALGRALAPQPEVLLLDEPFSNLDPKLREQVRRDVLEIIRATGTTTIFVTHDQQEALFVGDLIAVMNGGRIEQTDPPERIFHRPATRFVAQFIGTVDFLPARRAGDSLTTEVGSMDWPRACSSDQGLEVMVRPDCLECYPSDQGQGVITEREFRGGFYQYRVALPSGHTVRCFLDHTAEHSVGTKVRVALRPGHFLRPFVAEQAVAG